MIYIYSQNVIINNEQTFISENQIIFYRDMKEINK